MDLDVCASCGAPNLQNKMLQDAVDQEQVESVRGKVRIVVEVEGGGWEDWVEGSRRKTERAAKCVRFQRVAQLHSEARNDGRFLVGKLDG